MILDISETTFLLHDDVDDDDGGGRFFLARNQNKKFANFLPVMFLLDPTVPGSCIYFEVQQHQAINESQIEIGDSWATLGTVGMGSNLDAG